MLDGKARGCEPRVHPELVIDRRQVRTDRAGTDEQTLGDFRVGKSLGHQLQHIYLTRCQAGRVGWLSTAYSQLAGDGDGSLESRHRVKRDTDGARLIEVLPGGIWTGSCRAQIGQGKQGECLLVGCCTGFSPGQCLVEMCPGLGVMPALGMEGLRLIAERNRR